MRQRPGLMCSSRVKRCVKWLWSEKPHASAISAKEREDWRSNGLARAIR